MPGGCVANEEMLEMGSREFGTDRLLGFGDVLHLNMQVFNLHLHGFTSFNCSCTSELRFLQLEEREYKMMQINV